MVSNGAKNKPLAEDSARYNSVTCTNCEHSLQATGRLCWENMQIDLVKRAKRLAGVEEQEGDA